MNAISHCMNLKLASIDLFADMAAILISIVWKDIMGCSKWPPYLQKSLLEYWYLFYYMEASYSAVCVPKCLRYFVLMAAKKPTL